MTDRAGQTWENADGDVVLVLGREESTNPYRTWTVWRCLVLAAGPDEAWRPGLVVSCHENDTPWEDRRSDYRRIA